LAARAISVGSCQVAPTPGGVAESLREIKRLAAWATEEALDIVCLPEGFLTGYHRTPRDAAAHAIGLDSPLFRQVIDELKHVEPMLILGLIERAGLDLYNTAAILERGKLIGRYRKQRLIGEPAFEPGRESLVLQKNGVKFGVNICNDAISPRPPAL
jgi:predicted amidohydrolase